MIYVGLTGAKQSGKDTACRFLQSWGAARGVRVVRLAFADLLKLSAARVFMPDCTLEEGIEWADEIKHDGDAASRYEIHVVHTWTPDVVMKMTGREYLQNYGTEAHRDVFGPDFWVDQLFAGVQPATADTYANASAERVFDNEHLAPKPPEVAVISDVRFSNEAARLRSERGMVWRVARPLEGRDAHISEAPLDGRWVDYTLFNNSTLEDFEDKVRAAADEYIEVQLATTVRRPA